VGSELALPPEVDQAEVHQPARDGDQASALISFSAKTCSDNCLS
jgi:hypothetical protein